MVSHEKGPSKFGEVPLVGDLTGIQSAGGIANQLVFSAMLPISPSAANCRIRSRGEGLLVCSNAFISCPPHWPACLRVGRLVENAKRGQMGTFLGNAGEIWNPLAEQYESHRCSAPSKSRGLIGDRGWVRLPSSRTEVFSLRKGWLSSCSLVHLSLGSLLRHFSRKSCI